MADKKKDAGKLSREEQKEVKGGIPYIKPELIELDAAKRECSIGQLCDTGGETCHHGKTCDTGSFGTDPETK